MTDLKRVWALSTIGDLPYNRESRTVGLFNTPEDAALILTTDCADLDEDGYYRFAVIEPIKVGCVYPLGSETDRRWWEHNYQSDRWIELPGEPPEITKEIRSIGCSGVGTWSTIG